METIETILTRRSIRKYNKKDIPNKEVNIFLEAAMSAPSAGNEQPWHFIIINDPALLNEIPSFHNHSQMLKDASLAILVCGDINQDLHKGMWIQDCSAATENILLAVHAKKLGAVWLGIYPRKDRMDGMKNLCKLPDNIIPFSLVSIGYPAENKEKSNRFDKSRIHYNIWTE